MSPGTIYRHHRQDKRILPPSMCGDFWRKKGGASMIDESPRIRIVTNTCLGCTVARFIKGCCNLLIEHSYIPPKFRDLYVIKSTQ